MIEEQTIFSYVEIIFSLDFESLDLIFLAEQGRLLRILSTALFLQKYLINIYVELSTPISLNDGLSANNNNVRLSSLLMKNVLVS